MLENILNDITRLRYQWTDWDATWVVTSYHVPDVSATMRLPWRRPLPSNGALNIMQSWASGGRTREPILMKFGMQQQVRTASSSIAGTKMIPFASS